MAGEGSIFLRKRLSHGKPEYRWVATVRMPDGSRPSAACPHQHRPDDRRECAEAKANLAQLVRMRDDQAPLDLRTLTAGGYLERWVQRVSDLAPATWRQHEQIIRNHLAPAFPMRLTALRPSDVDAYLSRRDRDPQTLRHHRATLRRALQDAVRDGYLTTNPASLSRPPRLRFREPAYLTSEQAKRLIEGTKGDRLHALWVLALTTGLRSAELLGLAWSDIDDRSLTVRHQLAREDGEWVRRPPKTAKGRRRVPLTPLAQEALAEWRQIQAQDRGDFPEPIDGLVFTTRRGQPIHGPNLLPPLHKALKRLGLPRVGVHSLRHSTATMLFELGLPLPAIADILGHSTTRITADLYRHHVQAFSEDAAHRLQEALG